MGVPSSFPPISYDLVLFDVPIFLIIVSVLSIGESRTEPNPALVLSFWSLINHCYLPYLKKSNKL